MTTAKKTEKQPEESAHEKALKASKYFDKIEGWKKANPQGIHSLVFDDGELWFKRPGRNEMNFAHSKRSETDMYAYTNALASACWIGGDEALLDDEQAQLTIHAYMEQLQIGKTAYILNP